MTEFERILARRIRQAKGEEPADFVIRNATVFDLATGALLPGDIAITGDTVVGIGERYDGADILDADGLVAVPGYIDSHVHVESSLVTPFEFERMVLPRGVTAAFCDPHELANVAGTRALDYFFDSAAKMAMDLFLQLPGCVPATPFETAGAELSAADLAPYRGRSGVPGLAEMMNVPGVLCGDPGVLEKLALFEDRNIDGHAPLLSGRALNAYLAAGIRNCHETDTRAEAEEKLRRGMAVMLREGSAGRNLDRLLPLLTVAVSPFLLFCTDDRNPADIRSEGHIDAMVRRALAAGCEPLAVFRAGSWSAARAFRLFDRGLVAPGYRADIVLLDGLRSANVLHVIRNGRRVTEALFASRPEPPSAAAFAGSVRCGRIAPEKLAVKGAAEKFPVIAVRDGTLMTGAEMHRLPHENGVLRPDPERDILKCAVVHRHGRNTNAGAGFVRGFGLTRGALASSVGHDSHNLCAVGVSDAEIAFAFDALAAAGGGFVAAAEGRVLALLPLPVGGLMSDRPWPEVAAQLGQVIAAARSLGCPLHEPFQALAFLPLPVIPHLRLTDRGVFDVDRMEFLTEGSK